MNKKERFYSQSPRLTFAAAAAASAPADTGATPAVNSAGTIKGYAIVWNQLSTDRYAPDGSTYKVRLMPNSATFTSNCNALYEHETTGLIGTTSNGSLRILPGDEIGIPVEIDLPNTSVGKDVATLVADKYLSGMSFSMMNGFEQKTLTQEDGQTVYNVGRYTVDEVTVCCDPAFTATTVASADDDDDENDYEDDSEEMSKAKEERNAVSAKLRQYKLEMYRL